MKDVISIGDAALDMFVKAEETDLINHSNESLLCFRYGDKVNIDELFYSIGGSSANVAFGLSKLGLDPALIGQLGDDSTAEKIINSLAGQGIDVSMLKINKKIQTNFSIILRKAGDRTILVYHGLKNYADLVIPKNPSCRWFFISPLGHGYQSVFEKVVTLKATKGIKLAINLGTLQLEVGASHLSNILRVTDILFLNKMEAMDLVKWPSKVPHMKELVKNILDLGPEIVAITDGPRGAYVGSEDLFLSASAYSAEKVDPTGAGDAFASGFLASIIYSEKEKIADSREKLKTAMKWGLINSAAAITKMGAQDGVLTKAGIEQKASQPHDLTVGSL